MVSKKDLEERLAARQKKVLEQKRRELERLEKAKLRSDILKLRTRNIAKAGRKSQKFFKEAGKVVSKQVKKATPIVKKQIKLIREQQLRDEAIERQQRKKAGRTKKKVVPKKSLKQDLGIFTPLDF